MTLLHMTPPIIMNRKKVLRLMNKYNLICPLRKLNPRRKILRDLQTGNVVANLLKRRFEEFGPRTVLLTDITYLPYNGIFAYLSTILDAFTKQILAYVVSDSLEVDFVLVSNFVSFRLYP
jgi:putative transposase